MIVAAGTGERFGNAQPKQYMPMLGRPVLAWTLNTFKKHPAIREVYVVIHPDHQHLFRQAARGVELPPPILGGASRQESVRKGLETIAATNPDYILIHDAVRPGVTSYLIDGICAALTNVDAVVPVVPVADTVRRLAGDFLRTENRDGLYATQTPQAFKFDLILELHRRYKDASVTDDAALCELAGIRVGLAKGEVGNFKITNAEDLLLMEHVLAVRGGHAAAPASAAVVRQSE